MLMITGWLHYLFTVCISFFFSSMSLGPKLDITIIDQSLKLFEEGAKLAGQCEELLDKAEQKVSLLLSGGEEVPFEEEDG